MIKIKVTDKSLP